MTTRKVLLVYPRFTPGSFWNFRATCEVIGKRCPAAPLGLITMAALLPRDWRLRLLARNAEDLSAADLDGVDLVMTGGMLVQQRDTLDIIELFGRVPRVKSPEQMLAELGALLRAGWRGHVDFVDDNLIGNKKALKIFLPQLARWLAANDYPFEFSTQASLNLSDDDDLLSLMRAANFFVVFLGIESADEATLVATRKKQNTRRDIAAGVRKIYSFGMFVIAGFIVGFDAEKGRVAAATAELIEQAAIPVCMIGVLSAFPNTQLSRRLRQEGRLYPDYEVSADEEGDHCTEGLNFDTLRPRAEVMEDCQALIRDVYLPQHYFARIRRVAGMLDCRGHRIATPLSLDIYELTRFFWFMHGAAEENARRGVEDLLLVRAGESGRAAFRDPNDPAVSPFRPLLALCDCGARWQDFSFTKCCQG